MLTSTWASLPAPSDITASTERRSEDASVSPSVRAEGQARVCRWPLLQASHKNDSVTTSAVSHCTQSKHFFIGCFRCWTRQPWPRARTSARCIMGTIYQSHHVLQALNKATVFCASLFFSLPSFSPLSLTLSLSLSLSLPLSLDASFAGAAVSF